MAVNPIMTETLPTLVGMGVVSRTTDTVFGGKRKRSTRRTTGRTSSRKPTKTRKLSGKVYRLANTHTTKRAAEKDAEYFRKAGHSARVVYANGKYAVYVR